MTLDEAIKHCEDVVKSNVCDECKNNHKQLKSWLVELKDLKCRMSYMSDPLAIGDRHEMGGW